MSERVDVVVIGAGGLGLSAALQLGLRGVSVVLLDKGKVASQTSPRAAGLACQVKNDPLQTRLARESNAQLRSFAEWAGGVKLTVHVAGGLKVARGAAKAETVKTEALRARDADIECELITPQEARALAPYYDFSDAAAIAYTPSDLYLEPRELLEAYVEACRRASVDIRAGTGVIALRQRRGEITSVETSHGVIEAGSVVDACGAWLGLLTRLVGFSVPVVALRHQLCVTERVEGITNKQAAVRVVESNTYMRPDNGGLMFGGYEPSPLRMNMEVAGFGFDMESLPIEYEPLRRLMDEVAPEVPILTQPRIREVRGGIPTMTADGNYIIDRVPGVTNLVVVGGCNVAGLTTSPAIGEIVASLVMGEEAVADLASVRLARFGAIPANELEAQAVWRYTAREEWD